MDLKSLSDCAIGKILNRIICHEPDADLNVMKLELSKGIIGTPHYNKFRDEVLIVLEGDIELYCFGPAESSISYRLTSGTPHSWNLIKAESSHQLNVLSPKAVVLEVIGGKFFEGACVQGTPDS